MKLKTLALILGINASNGALEKKFPINKNIKL